MWEAVKGLEAIDEMLKIGVLPNKTEGCTMNVMSVNALVVYMFNENQNLQSIRGFQGNLIFSNIELPEKQIYHDALNGLLPSS